MTEHYHGNAFDTRVWKRPQARRATAKDSRRYLWHCMILAGSQLLGCSRSHPAKEHPHDVVHEVHIPDSPQCPSCRVDLSLLGHLDFATIRASYPWLYAV